MAPKKSLFVSKTFWMNMMMAVVAVAGSGAVPAKYSVPAIAIANIMLRLISSGGVSVLGDPS